MDDGAVMLEVRVNGLNPAEAANARCHWELAWGGSFMPEEVADKGCRFAYQLDDGGMVGICGRCNWLLGVDLRVVNRYHNHPGSLWCSGSS